MLSIPVHVPPVVIVTNLWLGSMVSEAKGATVTRLQGL